MHDLLMAVSPRGALRRALRWLTFSLALAMMIAPTSTLAAQTRPGGFEVALTGTTSTQRGSAIRYSGIAYEVEGLATLRAREGLEIVCELKTQDSAGVERVVRTATARSTAGGHFVVEVETPHEALGHTWIDLQVRRPGSTGRSFRFNSSLGVDRALDLLSDRDRYEPGESVRVWTRAFDIGSRVPLPDVALIVELVDAQNRPVASQRVTTSRGGSASATLALSDALAPGGYSLRAHTENNDLQSARGIEIFQRTTERLMATIQLDQEMLAPGASLTGHVVVTTPSGSPVRGAQVELFIGDEPVTLTTDTEGRAPIDAHAPSFLSGDSASQTIRARVFHAAYGTITATAAYTISRTRWRVEIRSENGAIVPEIESTLFLAVSDARGRPIAAGQEVVLRGLGVTGGSAVARTDARGLAELRVRLPRGAAATMSGGTCAGTTSTSFEVEVRTRPATTSRVCVPVALEAQLAVHVARPVAELAGSVDVSVVRRPSASGRPVLVEVSAGGMPQAFGWIAANETRTSIALPAHGVGGVWRVHARAVSADDARGPLDGAGVTTLSQGSSVQLLVRPADAFAVTVTPDQPMHRVREHASVAIGTSTPTGEGNAWAALLVRDEAMMGGEQAWQIRYLEGELSAAMTHPYDANEERFLRAALVVNTAVESAPRPPPPIVIQPWDQARYGYGGGWYGSGLLRDPVGLREELYRRQLGPVMMQLEARVSALGADQEARARLLRTNGRRVEFAPDVLERLEAEGYAAARTLGDEPMTVAMLTQADPSFSFDAIARRVARGRLVQLLVALAAYVNPEDLAAQRASANEPPERWLSRLVQLGVIDGSSLVDPWGRSFELRRVTGRRPTLVLTDRAIDWELSSPGPDGVYGNADDVRDPFGRVVPRGTIYAVASSEDALMNALSRIAPGEHVLGSMARAYHATSLAAEEERNAGPVVSRGSEAEFEPDVGYAEAQTASMDEMTEMDGEGGGGMRAGYARAPAAQGAPSPSAPPSPEPSMIAQDSMRRERADDSLEGLAEMPAEQQSNGFFGTASSLIRQEFPATLHFVGEVPLNAQGIAEVDVPLLDALTTYRLEAIAWTNSGWITSGRGDVRVDQDAMVDAPVPEMATVGDEIRLPVRVQNRTAGNLSARVEVTTEGDLSLDIAAAERVDAGPRDAAEAVMVVRATRPGSGFVIVRALLPDGTPLDAVRRPLVVVEDARLVRARRLELVQGGDSLRYSVPVGASAHGPGEVRLSVAGAMFGHPSTWAAEGGDAAWTSWSLAMSGEPVTTELAQSLLPVIARREDLGDATYLYTGMDAARVARALGALWSDARMSDDDARGALRFLSGADMEVPVSMRAYAQQPPQVRDPVTVLLALAPAARSNARPSLRAFLQESIARIAREAANEGARSSDDAFTAVRVAAALALSGGPDEAARAREMLRRAEREVITVGDQSWLEVAQEDGSIEPRLMPTSLLALAYLGLDRPRDALPLLRTLARVARGASHWPAEGRALASAAASRLTRGIPSGEVSVTFDGRLLESHVEEGIVIAPLPTATAGAHIIAFTLPSEVLALAQLDVRYGLAWTSMPARPAPIDIAWEGQVGARETRSTLRLNVRNRGTRTLIRPVVELQLPAGAELDEATREALASRLAGPPAAEGTTLRLTLRPIAPGGSVRLVIPARWSVGGSLRGLGVSAWDDAQGSNGNELAVAVLPSRAAVIADRGAEVAPPENEASPPPTPPIPRPEPIPFEFQRSLSEGIR